MNLVDNYLMEVSANLSDDNRDDIIEELRGNIEERIQDEEERLNRDLSPEDTAAILVEFGHPVKTANQFAKQQYLIGPGLYLPYKKTMKFALMAIVIIYAFLTVASYSLSVDFSFSFVGIFAGIFGTSVYAAVIITVVFATMEHSGESLNWYDKWEPLKTLKHSKAMASRQDSISNVISDAIGIVLWNGWFNLKESITFGSDEFPIYASDIYDLFFLPVNVILLVSLVFYSYQLLTAYWNKGTLVFAILLEVATAVIILSLLLQTALFYSPISNSEVDLVVHWVNRSVDIALLIFLAFIAYDTFRYSRTLLKL